MPNSWSCSRSAAKWRINSHLEVGFICSFHGPSGIVVLGSFQKPFQTIHHVGSVSFPFCDGNLAFQALNWFRSFGGQCLAYFFANGAEFFCADHSWTLAECRKCCKATPINNIAKNI